LRLPVICLALTLAFAGTGRGWEIEIRPVTSRDLAQIGGRWLAPTPTCSLSYYYMLEGCGLASVAGDIEEDQTVGVRFNMADETAWHSPCDTNACLTLDVIKVVLYDVLPAPNDQSMNIQVYPSDGTGGISGGILGNRDFEPAYTGEGAYSANYIDFTNGGAVPGLDLSGCSGHFVALLTWKNSTGHPHLVLDIVSACVDSCATNAACCAMGNPPYLYPRADIHTYDYGRDPDPGEPEPICDPAEGGGTCPTYGYIEAIWEAYFCSSSSAVEHTTWGSIKSLYR